MAIYTEYGTPINRIIGYNPLTNELCIELQWDQPYLNIWKGKHLSQIKSDNGMEEIYQYLMQANVIRS